MLPDQAASGQPPEIAAVAEAAVAATAVVSFLAAVHLLAPVVGLKPGWPEGGDEAVTVFPGLFASVEPGYPVRFEMFVAAVVAAAVVVVVAAVAAAAAAAEAINSRVLIGQARSIAPLTGFNHAVSF